MNIKHILDNAKFYKNVNDTQIPNIESIRRALLVVKDFIIGKGLVLYGGMAIDLALKYYGHKGIYGPEVLPDYDFYSPDNLTDSIQIANILHERGYPEVTVINGMHLITRRVRINKRDLVADISYYAPEYFNRIPIINVGINIVHPCFQKIDLHRSLSYLYEGIPGREYFKNRLEKDIKRLNILEANIPKRSLNDFHRQIRNAKPIEGNFLIKKLAQTSLNTFKLKKEVCYTGIAAMAIICQIYGHKFDYVIKDNKITVPGPIEYFSDAPKIKSHSVFFNKTFDIFPDAIYHDNCVIYDNYGDRVCASKTEFGYVCNVHQLMASFLFKYIMTGVEFNWTCYEICCELINFDPLGDAVAPDAPEKKTKKGFEHGPLTINGDYYGKKYINITWMFNEKKENCLLEGKKYKPRPEIRFVPGKNIKIKPARFVTYKVDGSLKSAHEKKTTNCLI